jgi:uncharacterized protein YegJ (DUF2314 family)
MSERISVSLDDISDQMFNNKIKGEATIRVLPLHGRA